MCLHSALIQSLADEKTYEVALNVLEALVDQPQEHAALVKAGVLPALDALTKVLGANSGRVQRLTKRYEQKPASSTDDEELSAAMGALGV